MNGNDKTKSDGLASHARHIAATGDRWFLSLATSLSRVGSWVGRGGNPPARAEAITAKAPNIDIVPATAASSLLHDPPTRASDTAPTATRRRSPLRGREPEQHSAGVQPLLEALRRVVAEHTETGGTTLRSDERFWTLIQLLRSLTGVEVDATNLEAAPKRAGETDERPGHPESLKEGLDAQIIWKRKRRRDPSRSPSGKEAPSCTRSGSLRSSSESSRR